MLGKVGKTATTGNWATVRRALALGYPVTLVADGHSTLGNMQSFGPRVAVVPAAAIHIAA